MRRVRAVAALAGILAASGAGIAAAADVTVLDGATLRYDGKVVRLRGVAAPQRSEICKTSAGTDWPCGETAFAQLSAVSRDDTFACEEKEAGFVVCRAGSLDIGLLMVKEGLARADPDQHEGYQDVEARAREARVGIWE